MRSAKHRISIVNFSEPHRGPGAPGKVGVEERGESARVREAKEAVGDHFGCNETEASRIGV
jgi:hypothetical protein